MRDARVLVTRPAARARAWIGALEQAGACVVHLPLWRLELPAPAERDVVMERIREHVAAGSGWLAFTSAAAVEHCLAIVDAFGARESLAVLRVACVGPVTRDTCTAHGLGVHLVPDEANGQALGHALLASESQPCVLHPASSMARDELVDVVTGGGGTLARCVVTVVRPEPATDERAATAALQGLAAATFASPAAAERMLELVGETGAAQLRGTPAVAIGATTAEALRERGFQHVVVATTPRVDDVVTAVRDAVR